jgi:hypothetical protein
VLTTAGSGVTGVSTLSYHCSHECGDPAVQLPVAVDFRFLLLLLLFAAGLATVSFRSCSSQGWGCTMQACCAVTGTSQSDFLQRDGLRCAGWWWERLTVGSLVKHLPQGREHHLCL